MAAEEEAKEETGPSDGNKTNTSGADLLAIKDGSVDLVILLGYDQDIYSFNNRRPKRSNAVRVTNPNEWLTQSHDKKSNRYSVLMTTGTKVAESQ